MYPDEYDTYDEEPDPEFDIDDCYWNPDLEYCELAGSEECEFYCPYRKHFVRETSNPNPVIGDDSDF